MGKEHNRDREAARRVEHLLRRDRGRLFLYLDEIRAAIAQQRAQCPAGVLRFGELALLAHPAGGQGKDLESALALPGDVDGPAEPGLTPALRNGDRDFETPGRQRAELAAVGWLEIGVGEN